MAELLPGSPFLPPSRKVLANGQMASTDAGTLSPRSSREGWRQLLAQSNKEMLLELANRATSGSGGIERTVEELALAVADRLLAGPAAQQLLDSAEGKEALGTPPSSDEIESPKLKNIKAVPWTIWSGMIDKYDAGRRGNESANEARYVKTLEGQAEPDGGAVMDAGLELCPTTQQQSWMRWHEKPKVVLLVAKQGDKDVTKTLRDVIIWMDSQGCQVILEPDLHRDVAGEHTFRRTKSGGSSQNLETRLKLCWCAGSCSCPRMPQPKHISASTASKWGWDTAMGLPDGLAQRCRSWSPGQDLLENSVDLVVCMGGDGTLCWAAGLFAGAMPPVVAFAAGSLGFLTPLPIADWMATLMPILGVNCQGIKPLQLACRMRFQMSVTRSSIDRNAGSPDEPCPPIPVQALNEVLVHRGSSGHLVKLEVWVNETEVTMVQGDGLIIATPTGSTAYSLAAGGSMMHPSVPGIILTPVCPHSLSFRPVVLPDSAVVTVKVPMSARSFRVMVAVDGKDRIELNRGDTIKVAVSPYPLPTITKRSVTDDWFCSVNGALQWNKRVEQKALMATSSCGMAPSPASQADRRTSV
eukprot:TRINITY_DN22547_c0_g1_i1.p1 TRINITY_DN22547_c0_g1~~TRINITY_DN22547_c0_g1_i1.p1  ORF type:complete len:602 (-),score=77.37 TRINITY_DN22547_c0_g1_i1:282-2030(-)